MVLIRLILVGTLELHLQSPVVEPRAQTQVNGTSKSFPGSSQTNGQRSGCRTYPEQVTPPGLHVSAPCRGDSTFSTRGGEVLLLTPTGAGSL